MQKTSYRIDMLGTSFLIAADTDQSQLDKIVQTYKDTVDSVRSSTGQSDPLKLAIIAGIVLCDTSLKYQNDLEEKGENPQHAHSHEIAEITDMLISKLDAALPPTPQPSTWPEPPDSHEEESENENLD